MFSAGAIHKIKTIEKKINFIESIVKEKGSISKALEDEQNSRASITFTYHEKKCHKDFKIII
jgi:hypothetical protein